LPQDHASLQHLRDARERLLCLSTYLAQLLFEKRNCRVAFALVPRGDYEDHRLILRPRLEKFVYQASTDAEAEAAVQQLTN
jgi:hypothetical protein